MPSVEPGEYACIWYLPNADDDLVQVHGFVTFEGGRRAHGTGFWGDVPLAGDSFPQTAFHPSIRCDLSTGQVAMFLNATAITWFPERVRVSSSIVLVGFEQPAHVGGDVCVGRFQVTGQESVTGFAPLTRSIRFPKETGEKVIYEVGARDGATLVWEDVSATITSDFAAKSATSDLYRVDHRFSPHLTVELDEPIPVSEFADNWVDPIRWLVALSTGQSQDITVMTVTGEDQAHGDGDWAVFSPGVTQAPFSSDYESILGTPSALCLGPDGDDLLAMVRRWVEMRDRLHPIIHTFASRVGGLALLPPHARFQVLVQAIEGTYQTENPDKVEAAKAGHLHKRDEVMDLLRKAGANSKLRRYTTSSMGNYPPGTLNVPLEWVDAILPGSFGDTVGEVALVKAWMNGGTWADGLRNIRNALAHGNSAFEPAELQEVVGVVHRFTAALALRLLGAGDKALERAVRSLE